MHEEILDWKEGIGRVLNKRDLYVRLLGKFIDGEKDTIARVEAAMQSGKTSEASQLIHTTKGSAANLGAKALAAAALALEMAIASGAGTDGPLSQFTAAHRDTLEAMRAFISQ